MTTPLRRSTRKAARQANSLLATRQLTPVTTKVRSGVTSGIRSSSSNSNTCDGSQQRRPFSFSLRDPTVVFSIVCAVFPALRQLNALDLWQLVSDPVCVAAWAMLAATLFFASPGKGGGALLFPWEQRAAHWYMYLMNAVVFHFLLDFGVGTLKAFPVMQKQYQAMDTRYGCVPEHPCAGEERVMQPADPMVWVLTVIEAFIDTPLCLVVFFAYVRNWPCRRPLELVVATSHIVGTILFQGTELFRGLKHVPPSPNNVGGEDSMLQHLTFDPQDPRFEVQASFFWFAFVGCNAVWYAVPFSLGRQAWDHLVASEQASSKD